jgi:peptidoglycan glycosyltransferase
MNKIRQRTAAVLALVGLLVLGIILYLGRYLQDGADWAAFPVNGHAFTDGVLTSGTILDRNGTVLSDVTGGKRTFNESKAFRRAVLHAVGDAQGNIGTGALTKYRTLLMGYNPVTGLYSPSGKGNTLFLTIDAGVSAQAYKALDGRNGTILVYNYKTGAILCMVSAPGFDPENPPNLKGGEKGYEGIYINKALS